MEYYELINTVYLFNDIYFDEANEKTGKFINSSMLLDNELAHHVGGGQPERGRSPSQ